MRILFLVKILLLLTINVHAKDKCSSLFSDSFNTKISEAQIDNVINELHGLRVEMQGTDYQVAVIARGLFDTKYRELSKYLSELEIEMRLHEVSKNRDLVKLKREQSVTINNKEERERIYSLISYLNSKGLRNLSDFSKTNDERSGFRALNHMVMDSREDLIDIMIDLKENGHPLNERLFEEFDVNDSGGLNPPLTDALLQNKKSIARKLVQLGADVNHIKSNGMRSVLFQVSDDGSPEMIKFLVELGADINLISNSMSPLMRASYVGKIDNVRALIDLKADLNQQNEDGLTAIFWASRTWRDEIVQLLYESGADPNIRNKENKTALEVAYDESGNSGWRSRTITLIQITNDVNLPRPPGTTALTQYAREGQLEIVKALLEKGVDPRAKDSNGNTAYELAKVNSQTQVLQLLKKTYGVTE